MNPQQTPAPSLPQITPMSPYKNNQVLLTKQPSSKKILPTLDQKHLETKDNMYYP